MQAYCVKCRAKKEMKGPKAITMKNGRWTTRGACPHVGLRCLGYGRLMTNMASIE